MPEPDTNHSPSNLTYLPMCADVEVVLEHTGRHTSLAYGVDWSHHTKAQGGSLVGSCSFYDKTFSVWRP
jgi:diphthamide biosynthesis protein 7